MERINKIFIRELKSSSFNLQDLCNILEEVNSEFVPQLKDRIFKNSDATSFMSYIKKVDELGYILIQHNAEEIEGVSMLYANDKNNFTGYISLVAVRKKYQGLGVGNNLIKSSIDKVKAENMKFLSIKTWKENIAAISLYNKHGFKIVLENEKEVVLQLSINKII